MRRHLALQFVVRMRTWGVCFLLWHCEQTLVKEPFLMLEQSCSKKSWELSFWVSFSSESKSDYSPWLQLPKFVLDSEWINICITGHNALQLMKQPKSLTKVQDNNIRNLELIAISCKHESRMGESDHSWLSFLMDRSKCNTQSAVKSWIGHLPFCRYVCLISYLLAGMTEFLDNDWKVFSQLWKKFL